MKAFLLAAGLGTRLRPITDHTPKCLLTVGGRPLIDIWLAALDCAGVDEVLVNVHHMADQVTSHLATRREPPAVRTVFEPDLLGSGGTLWSNRDWVAGEELFLAVNGDNLTDFDLRTLVATHRRGHAPATLAVFRATQPSACGIVEIDSDGAVTGYVEKPAAPVSNLANAGLYAFHPSIIDLLAGGRDGRDGGWGAEPPRPVDIGFDLLPRLVGRAGTVLVEGYFRDIGTPESYQQAQADWPAGTSVGAS